MSTITVFNEQSELALAAYAHLYSGISQSNFINALKDTGMSDSQSNDFANNWSVIDSVELSEGASATIFEKIGKPGVRYLAIRGTELSVDDISADTILALGFPSFLNPQFMVLKNQVQSWIDSGVLPVNFTTTGHSLGGYLAAAIGSWYRGGSIYMYNAPGVGGVVGNIFDLFKAAFGLENVALVSDIYNFHGSEGVSVITGLGTQLSPPSLIQIDSALGSDLGPGNHSITRLVDAFSVYALYSNLDASLSLEQIGSILNSANNQKEITLESTIAALKTILLGKSEAMPLLNDKESFYKNLSNIQSSEIFKSISGLVSTELFSNVEKDESRDDFSVFLSLLTLSPVVIRGNDATSQADLDALLKTAWEPEYQQWHDDINKPDAQRAFTDTYLQDRAKMLSYIIQANQQNILPSTDGSLAVTSYELGKSETWQLSDLATHKQLSVTVNNGSYQDEYDNGQLRDHFAITFGSQSDDTLNGSTGVDHLYGGVGNDVIYGNASNDYLEGNVGNDELHGGDNDDILIGGAGDDTLNGDAGNDYLEGGFGIDTS